MTVTVPHPEHGVEDLCVTGTELYERALHDGHVTAGQAEPAPCLLELGLLQPAVDDLDRLEPVAPAVALHRLLRVSEARIADERRREERLSELFAPLMRLTRGPAAPAQAASPIASVMAWLIGSVPLRMRRPAPSTRSPTG